MLLSVSVIATWIRLHYVRYHLVVEGLALAMRDTVSSVLSAPCEPQDLWNSSGLFPARVPNQFHLLWFVHILVVICMVV